MVGVADGAAGSPCRGPGRVSGVWPRRRRPQKPGALAPPGPGPCELCAGAAPPSRQHPWALKGLTSPGLLTPEEEAARSASWHITLGHREERGLKTASVSSVNGGGLRLIAIGAKTGRKASPAQNRLPGCSLAPGHLSRGPERWQGRGAPAPVSPRPPGPGREGAILYSPCDSWQPGPDLFFQAAPKIFSG